MDDQPTPHQQPRDEREAAIAMVRRFGVNQRTSEAMFLNGNDPWDVTAAEQCGKLATAIETVLDALATARSLQAGTDGVALIRAERERQTEATAATQDDALTEGHLRESAALLIEYASGNVANWSGVLPCAKKLAARHAKDPVRLLTIAGAFVAAEIDRLQRAARSTPAGAGEPHYRTLHRPDCDWRMATGGEKPPCNCKELDDADRSPAGAGNGE